MDNALTILAERTSTEAEQWKAIDGPETGFGMDSYFIHPDKGEAYVNLDQDYVTIKLGDELVFEGEMAA